ncbi:MAG: terpene cyclase/mutase family protein, partial [Planctomycetales bacterium]
MRHKGVFVLLIGGVACLTATARLTRAQELAEGLKWLASRQQEDGGWRFEHPPNKGPLLDPTREVSRTKATGLVLLAFLGAGQTHQDGEYTKLVDRGLKFLMGQAKESKRGGTDLRGHGGMDAHALATATLCEAYFLSQDRKRLRKPAQQALKFLLHAQDAKTGGWGKEPNEAGKTVVTAWQVFALRGAQAAKLNVPEKTIRDAHRFLDSVQTGHGSLYGNSKPGKKPRATAAAL